MFIIIPVWIWIYLHLKEIFYWNIQIIYNYTKKMKWETRNVHVGTHYFTPGVWLWLGMVLLDNNYWYQTTSKNVDESNKGASVSLSMALVPLLLEELASSLITTGADEWVKLSHTSEYVLLFFVDTVIITNEVWIE